ncbi:MAG: DUF2059 domain-containing protein [Rhodocyclaceae bacterium]
MPAVQAQQQTAPYVIKTDTGLDECPRSGKSACLERLFKGEYSGGFYLAHGSGLEVVLEGKRIRTYIFYIDSPGKAPFNGRTDKGIGKGSSMDDVVRAYGPPDRRGPPTGVPPTPGREHIALTQLDYDKLGIIFDFEDTRLASIRVFTITPPGADPFADPFVDLDTRAGGSPSVALDLVQRIGLSQIYAANIRQSQGSQLKKFGIPAAVVACFQHGLTPGFIETHLGKAFADEFTTDELQEGLDFYKSASGKRFADNFRISTLQLLRLPTPDRLPTLSDEDRQNIAAFTRTPVGQQAIDPQANIIQRANPNIQSAVFKLIDQCTPKKAKR